MDHTKPIRSVKVDEMKIITGCYDKNIYIFDFDDTNEVKEEGVQQATRKQKDKNCIVS